MESIKEEITVSWRGTPLWDDPWTAFSSGLFLAPSPLREGFSGECNVFGYHTDALGSVLALTGSTGTIRTKYTYDPFGKTKSTGVRSTNPFQYTGRENDGTGLYYYRARYHSPTLQRFLSEDPLNIHQLRLGIQKNNLPAYYVTRFLLRHPQLLHPYSYVVNNPITMTDPFGLYVTCAFIGLEGLCFREGDLTDPIIIAGELPKIPQCGQVLCFFEDDKEFDCLFSRKGCGGL